MSTDLHSALRAVIEQRLEVARAAAEYNPSPWVLGTDQVIDAEGDTVVVAVQEVVAHIALHNPADAIRRYERDLKVLEWHSPFNVPKHGVVCAYEWSDGGYVVAAEFCDYIADLLDVYPEVTQP